MAEQGKKSVLQRIRESAVAQAIDKGVAATDKFLGPSGKAWLANGMEELRQVFVPSVQQIQAVSSPGTFATITTGEATAERMAGDGDKQAALHASYEVPEVTHEANQETTLDKIRGYAKDRAQEEQRMENGHDRGGMGMEM